MTGPIDLIFLHWERGCKHYTKTFINYKKFFGYQINTKSSLQVSSHAGRCELQSKLRDRSNALPLMI